MLVAEHTLQSRTAVHAVLSMHSPVQQVPAASTAGSCPDLQVGESILQVTRLSSQLRAIEPPVDEVPPAFDVPPFATEPPRFAVPPFATEPPWFAVPPFATEPPWFAVPPFATEPPWFAVPPFAMAPPEFVVSLLATEPPVFAAPPFPTELLLEVPPRPEVVPPSPPGLDSPPHAVIVIATSKPT
jgi:hypothetical protein